MSRKSMRKKALTFFAVLVLTVSGVSQVAWAAKGGGGAPSTDPGAGGSVGGGGGGGGSTDPGTGGGGGSTDPGTGGGGGNGGGNGGGAPTDPGTTDPGTTDPGTTDPGTTDPGTTDPGTTDPGTTDPGTTDSGSTDNGHGNSNGNGGGNGGGADGAGGPYLETDPGNNDPGNNDPGNNDPGNNDPGNNDPGNDHGNGDETGSSGNGNSDSPPPFGPRDGDPPIGAQSKQSLCHFTGDESNPSEVLVVGSPAWEMHLFEHENVMHDNFGNELSDVAYYYRCGQPLQNNPTTNQDECDPEAEECDEPGREIEEELVPWLDAAGASGVGGGCGAANEDAPGGLVAQEQCRSPYADGDDTVTVYSVDPVEFEASRQAWCDANPNFNPAVATNWTTWFLMYNVDNVKYVDPAAAQVQQIVLDLNAAGIEAEFGFYCS